jgi:hypothetical protein
MRSWDGATVVRGLGAVALGAILVWAGVRMIERRRIAGELEGLRDDLTLLRGETATCQSALIEEETNLHQFTAQVDSLHSALTAYQESNGGVPQAKYTEYLRALDGYKAAFADWQTRADSLHTHLNACQDLARRHNDLSDSIQTRLESLQGPH